MVANRPPNSTEKSEAAAGVVPSVARPTTRVSESFPPTTTFAFARCRGLREVERLAAHVEEADDDVEVRVAVHGDPGAADRLEEAEVIDRSVGRVQLREERVSAGEPCQSDRGELLTRLRVSGHVDVVRTIVSVKGQITGTAAGGDHFGFVAEEIGAFTAVGRKLPSTAGRGKRSGACSPGEHRRGPMRRRNDSAARALSPAAGSARRPCSLHSPSRRSTSAPSE